MGTVTTNGTTSISYIYTGIQFLPSLQILWILLGLDPWCCPHSGRGPHSVYYWVGRAFYADHIYFLHPVKTLLVLTLFPSTSDDLEGYSQSGCRGHCWVLVLSAPLTVPVVVFPFQKLWGIPPGLAPVWGHGSVKDFLEYDFFLVDPAPSFTRVVLLKDMEVISTSC